MPTVQFEHLTSEPALRDAIKRLNLASSHPQHVLTPLILICCSLCPQVCPPDQQQIISKQSKTVQGLWNGICWHFLFPCAFQFPLSPPISIWAKLEPVRVHLCLCSSVHMQVLVCVCVCTFQTNHLGQSRAEGADQSFVLPSRPSWNTF